MSAQFITHNEFDAGQDRLFMRLTAFMTGQLDIIKTQAREDKREFTEQVRTTKTELLEQTKSDKTEILTEIRSLNKRMGDLELAQTTLKETTEGYARDLSKQLADSVASINEKLNELSQRISKLESK